MPGNAAYKSQIDKVARIDSETQQLPCWNVKTSLRVKRNFVPGMPLTKLGNSMSRKGLSTDGNANLLPHLLHLHDKPTRQKSASSSVLARGETSYHLISSIRLNRQIKPCRGTAKVQAF